MSKDIKATNHIVDEVRVVLYLRLSKEDLVKTNPEDKSKSIKNQEMMLRSYARKNNWRVVGVYDDEDYSGADRDRPNFNKMIHECEIGNVDVVLVKTQARFARDIELVDKYIHNKFIEWGVRFVTHIEHIDNERYETKKTSQITAMTDEWYLEDTSRNIRETLKAKRKNGQLTASFTKYGFLKDPVNKNHLVIDYAVSNIIYRIYEEAHNGTSSEKIADDLEKDHIPSPLEYKLINGSKLQTPILKQYMNYKSIKKAGSYIVKVEYTNNEKQILKNLTTIEFLTDNITFNNKANISIRSINNDNLNIYYSTKNINDLKIIVKDNKYFYNNDFDFTDKKTWKKLSIKDSLPKNVTVIATNIQELDRTHQICYEYEISLEENRSHIDYHYNIFPNCDNENVNLNYKTNIRRKFKWCASTIESILTDLVYAGHLVQFKTTTLSYKNHKKIYNDVDKQIKVENTHEAIIPDDLFYSVQEMKAKRRKSCSDGKPHILVNKVYCENCGSVFYKCGKNDSSGYSYLCCKDKKNKWTNCDNCKYIRESFLHEFVKDKINILLDKFYDQKLQIKIDNNVVDNDLFKKQIESLETEKEKLNKQLESKNLYFQELYEDLKKGYLDEGQYFSLRSIYKDECGKLEERLKVIDKTLLSINAKKDKLKNKNALFAKYKHIDQLSPEIVYDFIEKIIIGKINPETEERKIHIIWNFAD